MSATCSDVWKWNKNRLERISVEGSAKERQLANLSLTLLPKTKSMFMRNCRNDPALPFYKNEEDYNKKQDKFDKLMKKVDISAGTTEKMQKIQEKIDKIFLT